MRNCDCSFGNHVQGYPQDPSTLCVLMCKITLEISGWLNTVVTHLYTSSVMQKCPTYSLSVMELKFAYTLKRVECLSLSLIPEQRVCITVCFWWQGCFCVVTYLIWKSTHYEVLPLVFDEKFDRDDSLVFIVLPLLSLKVDQVCVSLCTSQSPSVLLKDAHRTNVLRQSLLLCCSRIKNSCCMFGEYRSLTQTAGIACKGGLTCRSNTVMFSPTPTTFPYIIH